MDAPADTTVTLQELSDHSSPESLWIAIDGKVYDITSWVERHPGGSIPLLDLAGRDASDAFYAFHPVQVRAMLSKFLVGNLEPSDVPEIIEDYRKLRSSIEEEGLFETDLNFYGKQMICLAVLFGLVVATVCLSNSTVLRLLSAVVLGLIWNMCSFIGHDTGHNGITHNRSTDTLMGLLFGNLFTGIGIGWWKSTHNVHHIVCNSVDYDPDIQHVPLIAVSNEYFKSIYSFFKFKTMPFDALARNLVSYQHFYFYPLMAVARFNLYAQTIIHVLTGVSSNLKTAEMITLGLFFAWYSTLVAMIPSHLEKAGFVLLSIATSGILHVQIITSHFGMPTFVGRPDNHAFVKTQLDGTLDIDCPPWLDWFWGGLQFQIEHHLFPRLPRHNLRKIRSRVQQFAEKHGLPYIRVSFVGANVRALQTLQSAAYAARKLTNPEHSFTSSLLWDGLNARG